MAFKEIRALRFYMDHLGSAIHSAHGSYIDPKLKPESRFSFQILIDEEHICNPISAHRKAALFSAFALKFCSFINGWRVLTITCRPSLEKRAPMVLPCFHGAANFALAQTGPRIASWQRYVPQTPAAQN
jgi:hypothetical protein